MRAWEALHASLADDVVRTRELLTTRGWHRVDIEAICEAYEAWVIAQVRAAFLEASVVAS